MFDLPKIITLGPEDRITEPGFYHLPLAQHHGQPCDGPSVTSSILRRLETASPADVWAFHALNPDRYPSRETDALTLGTAMAAWIEGGPERLEEVVRVLPANKPNRPSLAQREAYKVGKATEAGRRSVEFWAKVEADPRPAITEAQWEEIVAAGKVLAADPAAAAALGGEPEVTAAFYDEETDLWVLSRPDQLSFSGMTCDYKRMAAAGRPFDARLVDQRITAGAYHMQMALACEAMERLTGHWPETVGIVAQCAEAPYHVLLRAFDEEVLRIGAFQNRRARRLFRDCLDSGHWPGPGEHVGAYAMPDWLLSRLLEEMNTAGTAP